MKIIKYPTLITLLCNFIILSYNCSIDSPKAPGYDVSLQLALIDTTYTIKQLCKNSDNLSINDDNMLEFNFNGTLDTIKVEDQLNIDPQNYHSEIKLGELEINVNKCYRDSSINFTDLLPATKQYDGSMRVIEPFTFSLLESDSISLGNLEYAKITSGTAVITVENHLSIPLGPPLTAKIFDAEDNCIHQILLSEAIPPDGGKVSKDIDLAGKTFFNPMYMELSGQSSGSGGKKVLIDKTDYVVVEIFVESIKASEAKALVEPFHVSSNLKVGLTNEMSFIEAKIHSGKLDLQLMNYIPLGASGTIIFEDIFRDDGTNLKVDLSLNSNQQSNNELLREIDLTGYIIKPAEEGIEQLQTMNVKINAYTDDSGLNFVELNSNDSIIIDISLDNISFEYITGILNQTELKLESTVTTVDLPEEFEDIQLSRAKLKLNIYNRINFPINVELELKGISNSNNEAVLLINETLAPRGEFPEAKSEIIMHQNNSEILDFMNNIPTTVKISGKAYIGDGITPMTIHRDDYVRATYDISTPIQIAFKEKVLKMDTTKIIIKPEDYQGTEEIDGSTVEAAVMKHLIFGKINVAIANHLPIGMEILLMINDELSTLYSNPKVKIGPIEIPQGMIDNNGDVIKENTKDNELILTNEDLDIFKNDTDDLKIVYISTQIHIFGTGGQTVSIYSSDYLRLNATTLLRVNVDPDD